MSGVGHARKHGAKDAAVDSQLEEMAAGDMAADTYKKLLEIQQMGKVIEAERPKPDAVLSKSRWMRNYVAGVAERPEPVRLKSRTHKEIEVSWTPPPAHRAAIISYSLRMNGILVYVGPDIVAKSRDLKAKSTYCFEVAATNSCGTSLYSHPIEFDTCAGPPDPPEPPGLIEASQRWMKVKWKPPWDGGSPILKYVLSVNERVRYEGTDMEARVENMVEATEYRFRVNCSNEHGAGEYSQESKFITLEGPPDIPVALEVVDQTFDSAVLTWKAAARAGATIDYFEVEVDGVKEYTGKEQRFFKDGMHPFQTFNFVVYAVNKYGRSTGSDTLKLITGKAPPEKVEGLRCVHTTAKHLAIDWIVPKDNGDYITHYILFMNGTQVK